MKDVVGTKQWTTDPVQIRRKGLYYALMYFTMLWFSEYYYLTFFFNWVLARAVATESIDRQKQSFRRWGVMANWNNIYKTMDKKYISAQLQLFYQLYEKVIRTNKLAAIRYKACLGH